MGSSINKLRSDARLKPGDNIKCMVFGEIESDWFELAHVTRHGVRDLFYVSINNNNWLPVGRTYFSTRVRQLIYQIL